MDNIIICKSLVLNAVCINFLLCTVLSLISESSKPGLVIKKIETAVLMTICTRIQTD